MTPRETAPSGDPLIARVRVQIADGNAAVRGREIHDGVEAWKITLTSGDGPPSVLWVRADDGKPLAIDDPGDQARNEAPEQARWTTYEVLTRRRRGDVARGAPGRAGRQGRRTVQGADQDARPRQRQAQVLRRAFRAPVAGEDALLAAVDDAVEDPV